MSASPLDQLPAWLRPHADAFSWILAENHEWDMQNLFTRFRKDVELTKVPGKVPCLVAADQSYRLWVNDELVSSGPARGFHVSWPYDELDLAPFLRPGINKIAARVYSPGASSFFYRTEGTTGLLFAMKAGDVFLGSDATWLVRREIGPRRGMVPASLQLFPQEAVDLASDPNDWRTGDFGPSGFVNRRPAWNCPPWQNLESRGVPDLTRDRIPLVQPVARATGRNAEDWQDARDLVAPRQKETVVFTDLPARAPFDFAHAGDVNEWTSLRFDLGRTEVGFFDVRIEGAQGGEVIDLLFAECLVPESGRLEMQWGVHCRTAFASRLVLRAGDQTHRFHHPYGFRHVECVLRNAKKAPRVALTLIRTVADLKTSGRLESSEPDLVALADVCAWTQRVCALDAYVDTPWREQAQWWGDARVQAAVTFHLCDEDRLLRRGIRQIGMQQLENGLTYGHAPTVAHGCVLPDFTLTWMLTMRDHWWQTGRLDAFQENRAPLERALAYFDEATKDGSLLAYDHRYWLFLDWTPLPKEGRPALLSFWWHLALGALIELAEKANDAPFATRLAALRARIEKPLRALRRPDGFFSDGFAPDGSLRETAAIHTQTLAILSGLAGDDAPRLIEKSLLPWVRGEANPAVAPSAFWCFYPFQVLGAAGHVDEVLAFLRRKWSPMVPHGTTWENFDLPHDRESHSHAWAAHPLVFLARHLGGVDQTAPAWKAVRFRPFFKGDFGGVTIPTPQGEIRSHWKRSGKTIDVELMLPEGVEAEIHLPGSPRGARSGVNRWTVPG